MGNRLKDDSKTLVNGFKSNDHNIMGQVYCNVFPKVKTHILNNNGDEARAKDVFQEAFVACWQNIRENRFEAGGNLEGYLFTIAKNKWTDHLRSARFKKTVRQDTPPAAEDEEDITADVETKREIMRAALGKLGSACKNLLTLFYFERKKMEEVARELGIGPASARNKKYRCMEQLRTLAQQIKNHG